ncbi:hypothetical protein RN001_009575 [Aquatica leii]|uniref:Lipid droplet-regulating VLDL assembly factor AUP1 n=1 Tax=Aquatica leii TaxID=1421715 RepID=A0AAN7PTW8_9COLE|nr:hypothetical protein RN001_009575 [Aquatica leii]
MPSRNISELYELKRYPQNTLGLFTFIVYLPFGIILLLLRLILGIQVFVFGFLLPDVPAIQRILCKLLCATLGIKMCVENLDKKENVSVYVSNYVSPFDHLVIRSVSGSVTPGKDMFNSLLTTSLGLRNFGSSLANFSIFKKNIQSTITENVVPIHFQPEFKQTNGKTVLKFKTWPFEICNRVQPICVEIARPFLDIKVSTFDSAYWTDTLAYLFSPCTNYKIRFLPVVERMNLSETEFAEKVREEIAHALKVELSEHSASDLMEWEKRIMEDVVRREMEARQRPNTTAGLNSNPTIHRMACQVKEVLPMVPYNTICMDLMKTRNVDQTITNILEGNVTYVPESPSHTTPSAQSSSNVIISPSTSKDQRFKGDSLSTAAPSFGKSAQDRTLSFQERKKQLIETARQRYIEKHGLNIVGSS